MQVFEVLEDVIQESKFLSNEVYTLSMFTSSSVPHESKDLKHTNGFCVLVLTGI